MPSITIPRDSPEYRQEIAMTSISHVVVNLASVGDVLLKHQRIWRLTEPIPVSTPRGVPVAERKSYQSKLITILGIVKRTETVPASAAAAFPGGTRHHYDEVTEDKRQQIRRLLISEKSYLPVEFETPKE